MEKPIVVKLMQPGFTLGSKLRTAARAETTGYAHSSRRAFDLQQRYRLR
jgi:hypothetical protein